MEKPSHCIYTSNDIILIPRSGILPIRTEPYLITVADVSSMRSTARFRTAWELEIINTCPWTVVLIVTAVLFCSPLTVRECVVRRRSSGWRLRRYDTRTNATFKAVATFHSTSPCGVLPRSVKSVRVRSHKNNSTYERGPLIGIYLRRHLTRKFTRWLRMPDRWYAQSGRLLLI